MTNQMSQNLPQHPGFFPRLPEGAMNLQQSLLPQQMNSNPFQKSGMLSGMAGFSGKPMLESLPIYNLFPALMFRQPIPSPNWNTMLQQQTLAYIQGKK